jgi:hydrogenase nickel incorporation protein HypB
MTCGCGQDEAHVEGVVHTHTHTHAGGEVHTHEHAHAHEHAHDHAHEHAHSPVSGGGDLGWHTHADGTTHRHAAAHEHEHEHGHEHRHEYEHEATGADLHFGHGPAGTAAPGMTQARLVRVERDILAVNDAVAERNRVWLEDRGVFALNLVSSPGSGKTTLLVRTIERLAGLLPVTVIEGDQQTTFDAERIRATGAPAIQINTGKGCHLDAAMVETALRRLEPAEDSVLMIENVGNLVCPAGFDLGEAHKVVVLSVTEGEDKPLKYPDMFHAASLMLLNKVDLLPHLSFDVERCVANARRVHPAIEIIEISATSGEGMHDWLIWIERGARAAREHRLEHENSLLRAARLDVLERSARAAESEARDHTTETAPVDPPGRQGVA